MDTKRCPYCAEEILAAAKKCKHCGEFLDGESSSNAKNEAKSETPQKIVVEQKSSGAVTLLVVLGIIALVLLIFGV